MEASGSRGLTRKSKSITVPQLSQLKAEQATAEQKLKWATESISNAVSLVLVSSPEVERLRNDVEVAERSLAEAINRLRTLPHGVSGNRAWPYERKAPDPRWSAAMEALRTDADAPLPQG